LLDMPQNRQDFTAVVKMAPLAAGERRPLNAFANRLQERNRPSG